MKTTWIVLCSLVLASCSSIRMRYDAEVETQGKEAKYTFEKSYDVGSYPALCGLTAIFLGGACWFYLVMPTTQQQEAVVTDGKKKLDKVLAKKPYKIVEDKTSTTGWKQEDDSSSLIYATHQ